MSNNKRFTRNVIAFGDTDRVERRHNNIKMHEDEDTYTINITNLKLSARTSTRSASRQKETTITTSNKKKTNQRRQKGQRNDLGQKKDHRGGHTIG